MTPVDVIKLESLLRETGFDPIRTDDIVKGFKYGFDIGYKGPSKIKRTAPNLKLRVGSETILWNKVMKEVKLG